MWPIGHMLLETGEVEIMGTTLKAFSPYEEAALDLCPECQSRLITTNGFAVDKEGCLLRRADGTFITEYRVCCQTCPYNCPDDHPEQVKLMAAVREREARDAAKLEEQRKVAAAAKPISTAEQVDPVTRLFEI